MFAYLQSKVQTNNFIPGNFIRMVYCQVSIKLILITLPATILLANANNKGEDQSLFIHAV